MGKGTLRIYLGAAPGVGKTYAMLAEAQRRRSRGTDVVGAMIETHGRRLTATMAEGLEIVPRRTMTYRGATFTEMDTDAVLARHPQVALVDELAHTNVPGCRNTKRWQDVDELLEAGIDVITTLNIQHLESLSAVSEQVTGARQQETLPDAVARRADQIELVDMTPEALRRRMAHGNVYPPNRIEAALTHYFRPGNLTALRELALLWLAGRVEEGLQRYRAEHGIAAPWETTERIVVAIAGEKGDEAVIRRAARIAARSPGSDLLAVHVTSDDGLRSGPAEQLEKQHALVVSVGGSFSEIADDDIPEALLRFARAENATQMVLGASRRGRLLTLLSGKSIPTKVARRAGHIDVHLVSRGDTDRLRPALAGTLAALGSRRARAAGANAEAAAVTRLAMSVLRGRGDPPALLEEVRQMFGLDAVSLLEQRANGSCPCWYVAASAGEHPPEGPGADVELPVSDAFTLAACGRVPGREDLRVLLSCASMIVAGLSYRRQQDREAQAARRVADLRSREALLAATGTSAREQLAVATAALTALAEGGAELTAEERAARLDTARRAVDRLSLVVADLRDLGRLHAGAVETYLRPVDLDEVMAAALEDLGPGGQHVTLTTAEDLPDVIADGALLTRMLTSLVADAVTRNPAGPPPAVVADARGGQVELRITDHGPGQEDSGASLAFRLARDLADAMGDTLCCEQVPGNGRTVTITLPAAALSGPAPRDPDLAAHSSLSDAERTVVPAPLNDLGPGGRGPRPPSRPARVCWPGSSQPKWATP